MAVTSGELPALSDFPLHAVEKLRFSDTDRLGHVNNAVFSTLLETGRVEFLLTEADPLALPGCTFVLASLKLDFLAELTWPGEVEIGTGVVSVGRSSMLLKQALFQRDRCMAVGETVLVQMNETTRRAQPLGEAALARLEALRLAQA